MAYLVAAMETPMVYIGRVLDPIMSAAQGVASSVSARGPPLAAFLIDERGDMNLSGILLMSLSLVFVSVGAIMFPNVTDASAALLAYQYSANTSITDATFTGLTSVIGITPTLVLLGWLAIAIISGFLGVKVAKEGGKVSMNPGDYILLAISLVFFALGLYIFPVALDGFAYIVHGGGTGINASFQGLSALVLIGPMLLLLGYVSGTILASYFGFKNITDY